MAYRTPPYFGESLGVAVRYCRLQNCSRCTPSHQWCEVSFHALADAVTLSYKGQAAPLVLETKSDRRAV